MTRSVPGSIFLAYQPIFNLAIGETTGVEALLALAPSRSGSCAARPFIPVLEDSGMIVDVGRWVLQEACRQGAHWHARGHRLDVSVNVSTRQLETDQLIEDISCALETSGFDARSLIVEITETAIMRNVSAVVPRLPSQGPRGPHRHRRLRHWLLLVGLPPTVPRRHPQDRPLLHLEYGGLARAGALIRTLVLLERPLGSRPWPRAMRAGISLRPTARTRCRGGVRHRARGPAIGAALTPSSAQFLRASCERFTRAAHDHRVGMSIPLGAVGNPGSELMAFRCRPLDSHDRLAGERWVKRREYDLLAMEQLEGRIAVVTGAANGIGLAIVEAFVDEGMRVIAADVDEEKLEVQAARLRNQGADIHAVAVDVRDSDAVDRVGQAAIERFGALHVAVNNAGVVMTGNSWEIALEEWHRVIDIDLWGVIHGIRTFVPLILTSGQEGHVVNVASMAAVLPLGQVGPYTVAKHGVLGLSDVLRAELETLGAPVGVSVVMPGLIRTAMNPIGTVEPSTVARNVIDAIRRRRSYVFTDDHFLNEVEDRLRAILSARSDVCD